MERRSIISLALVALLVGGGAWAFLMAGDDSPAETEALVDAVGNPVAAGDVPLTIVSTNPSTTETLFAFGIGDRVIGVSSYCDYPEEVTDRVEATRNGTVEEGQEMEIVGSFTNPNQETIVSLDPDIVLVTGGMSSHVSVANKLNAMGIRSIVLFEGKSFEEVYKNVRIVGAFMRMNSTADSLVAEMEERMRALQAALQDSERPDVLVSLSVGSSPWVCGNGSFLDQIITEGGGRNVFSDSVTSGLGEWFQVNKEVILDRDPDIIIVTAEHLAPGTEPEGFFEAMRNDTIWGNTQAVKEGNVHLLYGQANNAFCRQSPRVVDAAYLMAGIVHPELFGSELPMGIGDDYPEYLMELEEV